MPTSIQLTGDADSIRAEVIKQLQAVADRNGLSYVLDEDMLIHLPPHDEQGLPIVGYIDGDDLQAPDSTGGD